MIVMGGVLACPVTAALAWVVAGSCFWTAGTAVLGLLALAALVSAGLVLDSKGAKVAAAEAGIALAFLSGGLLWWYVGYAYTRAFVYVDNRTGTEIEVVLDGSSWLTIGGAATERKWAYRGGHEISVRERATGREIQRVTVTIPEEGKYIFNVLGAATYLRASVSYGRGGRVARSRGRDQGTIVDRRGRRLCLGVPSILDPCQPGNLGRDRRLHCPGGPSIADPTGGCVAAVATARRRSGTRRRDPAGCARARLSGRAARPDPPFRPWLDLGRRLRQGLLRDLRVVRPCVRS